MVLNVGSYFRLQADWENSITRQDLMSAFNTSVGAAEPPKTGLLQQAQQFYTSEDGLAQLIDVGLTWRCESLLCGKLVLLCLCARGRR